jgi:hypothetical protein
MSFFNVFLVVFVAAAIYPAYAENKDRSHDKRHHKKLNPKWILAGALVGAGSAAATVYMLKKKGKGQSHNDLETVSSKLTRIQEEQERLRGDTSISPKERNKRDKATYSPKEG